jgi:hypothetical protein
VLVNLVEFLEVELRNVQGLRFKIILDFRDKFSRPSKFFGVQLRNRHAVRGVVVCGELENGDELEVGCSSFVFSCNIWNVQRGSLTGSPLITVALSPL